MNELSSRHYSMQLNPFEAFQGLIPRVATLDRVVVRGVDFNRPTKFQWADVEMSNAQHSSPQPPSAASSDPLLFDKSLC